MAAPVIEYKTKDGVLEGLRIHNSPYWSIWQSTTLKWICEKEDQADSEDMLMECLDVIELMGTGALYTLRVYRDPKGLNSKKGYIGSFTFKINDDNIQPFNPAGGNNVIYVKQPGATPAPAPTGLEAILLQIAETNTKILEKLNQEEEEEEFEEEDQDEIEEDPNERIQRTIGMIDGIMEKYQEPILRLLDRIFPAQNYQQNLSGMPQQQQPAGDVNERLMNAQTAIIDKIGVDAFITALERLAALPADKLKGLLSMI